MPKLHVIAIGFSREYMLYKTGMPADEIQFLYLHPLSFGEFLTPIGREDLRASIFTQNISLTIHKEILELLKTYLLLGGMPEVVDAWIRSQDINICQKIQDKIIASYTQRFFNPTEDSRPPDILNIFKSIPAQIGKKFKFENVENATSSRYLMCHLSSLNSINFVHLCFNGISCRPLLEATNDEKEIKVYLLDIGLMQRMLGQIFENWQLTTPLQVKKLGGVAEQFVAQELLVYTATETKDDLYYWQRKKIWGSAEIDFIIVKNQQIIPVDVKTDSSDLKLFLNDHPNSSCGLKISESPFSKHNNIVEITLYGIEAWLKEK